MTFATLTAKIVGLANATLIPLMYALAFLFFVAGLTRYFFVGVGEENREKGKQMMIAGVIGLVIIFALWGFVNVLLSTFTQVIGTS